MERNSTEFLTAILPEPETLLDALAPEGWVRSPLHRVFHPDDPSPAGTPLMTP